MAGNTPPAGGTPREWLTRGSGSQELVNSIDKWADHYGIPRQFVYDLVWRENGIGAGTGNERLHITTSDAGATGPMQLVPAVRNYYGINANSSMDDMVFAGVSLLFENGTNTGYGRLSNVNGGQPFAQWDPAAAAGMYIAGPDYYRWLNGSNSTQFGPISQSYVIETTRNTIPLEQLPERFRNLPITRFYGDPHGSGDLGVGPSFDPGVGIGGDAGRLQPTELDLAPPERFSPTPGFEQGLPFGPTRTTPDLAQWLNDPAGGGGLPPEVRDLAFGPAAFASTPERNVPWVTPGMIDESLGTVLQQYGYMPSNLQFNEFTGTWDVAQEAPLWVQPYGPWGNIAVDRWRDANADNPAAAGMRWYTDVLRFPQNEINLPDRTAGEELLARLGQGPGGFVEGERTVPWLQSNVISEAFGNALRQQGLMPSNLSYNQTSGTWDTAETNPLWVNWYGPWGAEAVDRWSEAALLPEAQRMQQYVDMLRYPQVDQPLAPRNEVLTPFFGAQLEPSYYGIPNTYGVPSSGVLANWFGQADPVTFQQPQFMGDLGLTQNYDWYFNAFNQNNPINQFGRNSGGGSWSPFSGYGPPQYGDFEPGGTFAEPIDTAGGGGGNMPVDEWGRVQQNTVATPPGGYGSPFPAPTPAPTPWYYNSGIGPGGIEIAPGWNTQPIFNPAQATNIWNTGSTNFNPVTGQSVNIWNPLSGINSLTGQPNWM